MTSQVLLDYGKNIFYAQNQGGYFYGTKQKTIEVEKEEIQEACPKILWYLSDIGARTGSNDTFSESWEL